MAWQRAQLFSAKFLPRCSVGDAAAAGASMQSVNIKILSNIVASPPGDAISTHVPEHEVSIRNRLDLDQPADCQVVKRKPVSTGTYVRAYFGRNTWRPVTVEWRGP